MKIIKLTFAALVLSALPQMAFADIRCPRLADPNRDALLADLFHQVPADPLDGKTILKQDAIFNCLEVLINNARNKMTGKAPSLENVKQIVYWTAKAYQYKNDEDASDFVYILSTQFFKPNRKLTVQALEALASEGALTRAEATQFKEGADL